MSDFDFNIDLNDIEEQDNDFSPIEEGTYELAAEEWEQKTSKNNNQYLKVKYRVLGPNYANRVLWENFTIGGANPTIAIRRLKEWIVATGQEPGVLSAERMPGLMSQAFFAKVGIEESAGYDPQNKIVTFLRPKNTVRVTPQQTQPKVTPTQSVPTATGASISADWD
jgi:hypothetical protein